MYYVSYAVQDAFRRDLERDPWAYRDGLIDRHPLIWLAEERASNPDRDVRIVFWDSIDAETALGLIGPQVIR